MRISTTSVLACGLALSACSLYFERDPDEGPGGPGPCELAGTPEVPGHPFDVPYYQQVIWPLTQRTCGFTGCHAAEGNGFGFRVWADDGATCSMIQSFNELYAQSDFYDLPENSTALRVMDGSVPHPVIFGPGTPEYDLLYGYIWDAWSRYLGNPNPAVYFDAIAFAQEIQPMLDAASCSVSGCHEPSSAVGGFALHPFPGAGSPEMTENLASVSAYVDFAVPPESTRLYQRATDRHGGTSVFSPESLLAWIQAAYDAAGY